MSAALLNSAALPGATPGAGAGIAAQAAQAVQSHGPLAGFEAMLAAFFGDQGLVAPGAGGPTNPGQAIVAALTAGKTAGKPAGATDKAAAAADSDKTAGGATAPDAIANGADAAQTLAAQALIVPTPTVPVVPATQQAGATDSEPDDAGRSGKVPGAAAIAALTSVIEAKTAKDPASPALAALTAAVDAKTAKAAGVAAQDSRQAPVAATPPQTPTTAAAPTGTGQPALPEAAAKGDADIPPALPVAASAVASEAAKAEANIAKDKAQGSKAAHVDGAPADAPPIGGAGKTAIAIPAFAGGAGKDASSDQRDPNASIVAADAKPAADASQGSSDFNLATNSTLATNPAALAHAAALVRGSPQTVANLAAQIAKKLDGRSTRFDVQLDPAGLGKVDVRVEIDAAGKMTAAMNFDNQQAANELKSRAGELQRALEQAGFDMSGGMSFDVAGQGGQGARAGQDGDTTPGFRGRAFQAVLDGGADAASAAQSSFSRTSKSGVDIRI